MTAIRGTEILVVIDGATQFVVPADNFRIVDGGERYEVEPMPDIPDRITGSGTFDFADVAKIFALVGLGHMAKRYTERELEASRLQIEQAKRGSGRITSDDLRSMFADIRRPKHRDPSSITRPVRNRRGNF
jgi:hypothetical protein